MPSIDVADVAEAVSRFAFNTVKEMVKLSSKNRLIKNESNLPVVIGQKRVEDEAKEKINY